jgi:hypothetical protein
MCYKNCVLEKICFDICWYLSQINFTVEKEAHYLLSDISHSSNVDIKNAWNILIPTPRVCLCGKGMAFPLSACALF